MDKNVLDVIYKKKVKKVGLFKYYMNEVFCVRFVQYENDENYRLKVKEFSKKSYYINLNVKRKKMENIK